MKLLDYATLIQPAILPLRHPPVGKGVNGLVEKIPILSTGKDAEKIERMMLVLPVTVAPMDIGDRARVSMWPVGEVAFFEAVLVVHAAAGVADVMIVIPVVPVVFGPVTVFATIVRVMTTPAVVAVIGVRGQRQAGQPQGQQGKQGQLVYYGFRFHESVSIGFISIGVIPMAVS